MKLICLFPPPIFFQQFGGSLIESAERFFLKVPGQGAQEQLTPERLWRLAPDFRSPRYPVFSIRHSGQAGDFGGYHFGGGRLSCGFWSSSHAPNHAPFAPHVQSDSMSQRDMAKRPLKPDNFHLSLTNFGLIT